MTPDPVAMTGSGVCWRDDDGDGWLDLYAVNSYADEQASQFEDQGGLPHSALFHNEEGRRFVDVSDGSGADLDGRGTGCVAADFDRDGRTDLYVTGADAGARFREGAEAAGAPAVGWYAGRRRGRRGRQRLARPVRAPLRRGSGGEREVLDIVHTDSGSARAECATVPRSGKTAGSPGG